MKKKYKDRDSCEECSGKRFVWKTLFEAISKCMLHEDVDSADIAHALVLFTGEYVYENAPSSELATGMLIAVIGNKLDELIEDGSLTEGEVEEDLENLLEKATSKNVKIH